MNLARIKAVTFSASGVLVRCKSPVGAPYNLADWEEIPGVRSVLEILSRCGYQLALLSNSDNRSTRKTLRHLGFAALLQELFFAKTIGFGKPDGRFFEHARRTLDLAPHEILHVGVNMERDVNGALEAGWQAALLGGADPQRADILYLERITDLVDALMGPDHD